MSPGAKALCTLAWGPEKDAGTGLRWTAVPPKILKSGTPSSGWTLTLSSLSGHRSLLFKFRFLQ